MCVLVGSFAALFVGFMLELLVWLLRFPPNIALLLVIGAAVTVAWAKVARWMYRRWTGRTAVD
jgi:xanthosine utilization system XapX-like protein